MREPQQEIKGRGVYDTGLRAGINRRIGFVSGHRGEKGASLFGRLVAKKKFHTLGMETGNRNTHETCRDMIDRKKRKILQRNQWYANGQPSIPLFE